MTVRSTVAQTDTVLVAIPGMTGILVAIPGTGILVGGVLGIAADGCTTIGAPLAGFHSVCGEGVGCQLGLLGRGVAMSHAETTVAASAAAEID